LSAWALHPKLADIYRDKAENLNRALNEQATRAEAAEPLRALNDEIRLVPENGRLEIELAGDLARIPALTAGSKKPASFLEAGFSK
jgi:site-specific DNA recombinase